MKLLNKRFIIVTVAGLVVSAAGLYVSGIASSSSSIFSKFGRAESANQAASEGRGKNEHAKVSASVAARDFQKNQTQGSTYAAAISVPPRTIPLAATPLKEISKEEEKRFPGAKVVSSAEVEGPGSGQVTRVRILETDFKYPYLRTEEVVDQGSGQVISREEMVANHVLVTLNDGEDPGALIAALGGLDVQLERVSPDVSLYRLHLGEATLQAVPAALDALDQRAGMVQSAEPDFVRQSLVVPNDPKYLDGTLWGLNQSAGADIDAPEGWDVRNSASNVIVAVIDTGIRYTHQDLAANMWRNPNEIAGNRIDDDGNGYVDDVYGCNAYKLTGDPMDDNGHGTHCSGTIGGVGNNGLGVTGVAWGVKLMACKFLSASGSGTDSDAVSCIDYARVMGAKVLSCSWGGGGPGVSLSAAIDRARAAGIVLVAAAGNNGLNNDTTPNYPSSYPQDNVVAVAATTRTDSLASFSNYGSESVDIAAPGDGIYSTVSSSDSAYATKSGTSMATPHVSGVLALLAAQYPSDTYLGLIQRLKNGADAVAALSGKTKHGRLNLAKALGATNNPTPTRPANDNFVSAAILAGKSWSNLASNENGTSEVGEPSHAGQAPAKSVWFRWTAPSSGYMTIKTEGSNFDTVLAVYVGSSVGALTAVASNDNRVIGVTDSMVVFEAVAGTVYRIAVDGKSGVSGIISIKGEISLPNDAFASALLCTGTSFSMSGSNFNATNELGEPRHANKEGGKSVWWSWAAPADGKLELSTAGSSFDTLLAVYTGNTVNALQLVGSNDDVSKIDVTSKLIVSNIIAGTQYRIAVDGYRGASGSIKLSGKFTEMVVLPPPSNVVATQDKSGRVQVSWAVLPGAITYDLQINAGTKVVGSWRGATNNVKTIGALSKSISLTVNVRGNAAGNQPGVWSGVVPVVK